MYPCVYIEYVYIKIHIYGAATWTNKRIIDMIKSIIWYIGRPQIKTHINRIVQIL